MVSKKKAINETSVLQRVSEIMNLFSEETPTITPGDVGSVLNVSQATAYRYLHDLHEIGFLSRVLGRYAPGPKIMELEYVITKFDPILVVSKDLLNEVSTAIGCHVLLGRLYGSRLINVYSCASRPLPELNFSPGRRMPLFRGSQARVILSEMDRRRLHRIFVLGESDSDRDKIGKDWASFSAALQKTRRDGYYISREELDPGVTGIAAPVFDENEDILGSLVFAYSDSAPPSVNEAELVTLVMRNAAEITKRIAALAQA